MIYWIIGMFSFFWYSIKHRCLLLSCFHVFDFFFFWGRDLSGTNIYKLSVIKSTRAEKPWMPALSDSFNSLICVSVGVIRQIPNVCLQKFFCCIFKNSKIWSYSAYVICSEVFLKIEPLVSGYLPPSLHTSILLPAVFPWVPPWARHCSWSWNIAVGKQRWLLSLWSLHSNGGAGE